MGSSLAARSARRRHGADLRADGDDRFLPDSAPFGGGRGGPEQVLKETGGAIGLALFTSVLLRHEVVARAGLAAHLGVTNPLVAQRVSLFQALTPGLSPSVSQAHALGSLQALVARAAAVCAYEQLFLLLGAMMLTLLPLVFLLKVDRNALAHAEPEAD